MFKEIDANLNRICRDITKNGDLFDDLKQEVLYALLREDRIKERYDEGTLYGYAFGIAYRMYNFPKSKFFRTHRKYKLYECEELDQVPDHEEQKTIETRVADIMNGLTEIDRLWVREWLRRNCSFKKVAEDTGLHRASVTERIKQIIHDVRCTTLN